MPAEYRRYLLLLRFALLNATAAAFIGAVWMQGWLDQMFATDSYHVVKLICIVFLFGLQQCAARIIKLSTELNELDEVGSRGEGRHAGYLRAAAALDGSGRAALAGTLRLKLATRLASIRYIAGLLVLLGLIGTVIGFIIALAGIDPAAAGDLQAIGPMVSQLVEGMAIALYTTLAGSILNIWLMLNYRLLEHGTVHLYTRTIEMGERP
jgi:biopolymer transport protein ExbB/TolQ